MNVYYKYWDNWDNLLGEITLDSFLDILRLDVPLDVDDSNIKQAQKEDSAPETSAPPDYGLARGQRRWEVTVKC